MTFGDLLGCVAIAGAVVFYGAILVSFFRAAGGDE